MKKLFATTLLAVSCLTGSISLAADTITMVSYNRWTALPHCGGETRLICENVPNARQNNRCSIEFRNSYGCPLINLYVASDFYPKYSTSPQTMQGSFYVDNSKINWTNSFRVFMHNADNSNYDKIYYQFDY